MPLVEPLVFTFLLGHDFSMMSLASAIEPLRSYNRLYEKQAFNWHLASLNGEPVVAANGIPFPTRSIDDVMPGSHYLFICGGERVVTPKYERGYQKAMRQAARAGIIIGSLSTGTFLLAKCGLLKGYRCTIHWESRSAFKEIYPDIQCTHKIFEIDRGRLTCSGGTAAMDMMLNLIAERYGDEHAASIANQFHHERIRSAEDDQRGGRPAGAAMPAPLGAAIAVMQAHIEDPISLPEVAKRAGVGKRQLERLFAHYFDKTPQRFYLELRLEQAREMLIYSDQSIIEIAVSAGFGSTSHFAGWFRRTFGVLPSAMRRVRQKKNLS
ncbi:AraC family transcriptional regulator with amidase-like domain [Sodalis ligni]|uniref:AraC family transcriptional regulator with amidase-like domain n=2 Tax=Sodalis ligni TaxID=2697027 RepID=A0A4R1NL17_9GAMM|nr:GlxA family transcriptional regulator [Sodalis ligni]TCL05486.1 AraC family transcriptional regulator with amidase-like domain [Sodalis ligni]